MIILPTQDHRNQTLRTFDKVIGELILNMGAIGCVHVCCTRQLAVSIGADGIE